MKYHETKSEWIANSNNIKIKLDSKDLNRADKAKYLGDILTADGKLDETIAARKSTISGMVAELSCIMEEVGEMKIEAAVQYYTEIIYHKKNA